MWEVYTLKLLVTAVALLVFSGGASSASDNKTIKIGYLGSYSVPRLGPAINVAIDLFQKRGGLTDYSFEVTWRAATCTSPYVGVAATNDLHLKYDVDVIMGPLCSTVCVPAGYNLQYWNIPHFPAACTDPTLGDKTLFPTMIRTSPTLYKLGGAMVELLNHYQWNNVVMWHRDSGTCQYGANAMRERFRENNITVTEWIRNDPNTYFDDDAAADGLERARHRGRIIIFCQSISQLWRVMMMAGKKGMTGPEYVYIYFAIYPSSFGGNAHPWTYAPTDLPEDDMKSLKKYFSSLKQIYTANMELKDKAPLFEQVLPRLADEPWSVDLLKYNYTMSQFSGSMFFLADAAYLYLTLINETLYEGGDFRDGRQLALKSRNRLFPSITNNIKIDSNSDREPDFTITQFAPNNDEYYQFALIDMVNTPGELKNERFQRVEIISDAYWRTTDGREPPDTPVCGFRNENCPPDNRARNATFITVGVIMGIMLFILAAFVYWYRQRQLEIGLHKMLWQVEYDELDFMNKTAAGSVIGLSSKSIRDHDEHSLTSRVTSEPFKKGVAFFRGVMIVVKHVTEKPILLTRNDLWELKLLKEITHDNLNQFIGACIKPPNICVLNVFCPKGTLQDVLENDDIKLDWTFKCSLMTDLANGISYLHQSPLISHGRIKSSSCLIDSRWTLKLTDYGLGVFRSSRQDDDQPDDFVRCREQLWTAPELLRDPKSPVYGSQAADSYSFGIILQEILFRALPFFYGVVTPQAIVRRVKGGETPPFRPNIFENESSVRTDLSDIMCCCWEEDPYIRPTFRQIKRRLRKLYHGQKVDIVDAMLNKLEKYAANLEDIVSQRTSQLLEEKKKTDMLLYRMLPKTVAERLKTGQTTEAEFYPDVTIYFSDIVGFTSISSESTPMEIVNLLNDLYTLFDDIIDKHDVYKVETIGDAYMVASGIPSGTSLHSCHAANLALDSVLAAKTFKIPHLPQRQLMVRVGLHSGPCAAGVVGHVMPRYCLFGDTVNVASRMESTGEANKIQLSLTTKERLSAYPEYLIVERGQTAIKGKGTTTTFWLLEKCDIGNSSV